MTISTKTSYPRSNLLICAFPVLLAFILSVTFWVARYGFNENSFTDVVKTFCLALFILLFPNIFKYIAKWSLTEGKWYRSDAALTLIALVLTLIAGYFSISSSWFGLVFVVLGGLFGLVHIGIWVRKASLSGLVFILFTVIFSLWLIGVEWGYGVRSPLFLEKIYLGSLASDTLFHTSITSMIQTYNFPSTGLDGIPYLHYYWGSHWTFAQLSNLLNISPLKFYNLVYPVLIIPLLFKILLSSIAVVRKRLRLPESLGWPSWIVLFLGFIGFLPWPTMTKLAMGWHSIFTSESYTLSIILLFSLIEIITVHLDSDKSKGGVFQWLFWLIVVPALLAIMALTKISTAIIAMVFGVFLLIRIYRSFTRPVWISGLLGAVIVFLAYVLVRPIDMVSFMPFDFLKTNVQSTLRYQFFFVYFATIWACAFLVIKQTKVSTFTDLAHAIREKKLLIIEALFFTAFISLLPGFIFRLPGGSAAYFAELSYWIGLLFLVAYLPATFSSALIKESIRSQVRSFPTHFKLSSVIILLIAVPVLINSYSLVSITFRLFPEDLKTTRIITMGKGGKFSGYVAEALHTNSNLGQSYLTRLWNTFRKSQEAMSTTQRYKLLTTLENLRSLPAQVRRHMVIFIPATNTLYWNLSRYRGVQFISPILSGIASIFGIQPFFPNGLAAENMTSEEKLGAMNSDLVANYEQLIYYDYKTYAFPTPEEYVRDTSDDVAICQHAFSKYANTVFVIDAPWNNVTTRTISCETNDSY